MRREGLPLLLAWGAAEGNEVLSPAEAITQPGGGASDKLQVTQGRDGIRLGP